ncbi:hypothetical protein HLB23_05335 [Nocardia uniformis]|uniref:Uncharacterized protein n=1 Tax=Nocardia uniformis TaxID=53432 RepID=A0A849BW07_9NOCA|nr:hypothetical protein [Nocardia uniformis]NNH69298.1 hypothetical protein [Nocardia uniformis]
MTTRTSATTKYETSGFGSSAVLLRAPRPRSSLRRRWFVAVTLGELLGFVAPAVVGVLLVADGPPAAAVVALLLAAVIQGSVLGWFQAGVLRKELRGFHSRDWIVATIVGALVAWTIGLVPMLYGEQITDWPVAIQAPVIALGAIVMVFALGVTQWFVLRNWTNRAALWIWASALGWIGGLAAFAAVTTPLWQPGQHAVLSIAIGGLGGVAMAAAMAFVTGAFLVPILNPAHAVRR